MKQKQTKMDQERLFKTLAKQKKVDLLEILKSAYQEMDTQQRYTVFGDLLKKPPPQLVKGKQLLAAIQQFHRNSLKGVYYAPFRINSKNFSHISEETNEWFEKLADLLKSSTQLSKQSEHVMAIACFKHLYDLVEHLSTGEEIVFAEEVGMWLLPGDEKVYITAYLTSLVAQARRHDSPKPLYLWYVETVMNPLAIKCMPPPSVLPVLNKLPI